MGIIGLIGMLFGADVAAPPDAIRLDATTETTLTRSLSALLPDERGWITFAGGAHLVLVQGRTIRVPRNGPGRQKKHPVVRGTASVRRQLHAIRGAGLFRKRRQ